MLTRKTLTLLGTLGSIALILGALAFQHIGGMPPCKLCYWQRYGHWGAIAFGAIALVIPNRILLGLAALSAAASSAVGVYHTGVERKWWEGPTSCTGGDISGMSTDDLFDKIMSAPVIRCDEIPWEMFGLSMANYNVVASAVIAVLFIMAARADR